MPLKIVKAFSYFIDWFHEVKLIKKIYVFVLLIAVGLFFLLKYYETQINIIHTAHNNRVDSITRFFNNRLQDCNSENKEEYTKLLQILNNSLEEQKKMQIEAEKIKLESEKIKLRLIKK